MTIKALRSLKSSLAYEGWTMVAIGFICIALAFGASMAAMPLMYHEVMTEFGWSRTQATMMFTYKNIASAVMALFIIAPLYARFGLRPVMIGSLVLTGTGMVAFLWVDSLTSYYLAGFLLGLGVSTVLISTKVLISRWFMRRQGMAIGIVLTGANAGGIVFPVLYQWLLTSVGWRAAFALLSLGIWAVTLPLYALKARNTPSSEDTQEEALSTAPEPQYRPAEAGGRFPALMRSPTFWTILVCIFTVGAVDMALFQHTALFLELELGISATRTAYCISAIFGIGILAKILAGKIFDIWSIKGVSFMYILTAITLAAALNIQGAFTLLLFVVLRGFSHGGLVSETPVIAKHCYGPGVMDYTLPVFAGTWAVGAAVGPVALSMAYDRSGNYQTGFLVLILLTVGAAALLYRVRPLYRLSILAEQEAPPASAIQRPEADGGAYSR